MRKSSFLILILTIIWVGNLYGQQTENVVIAVIDGARYTETFGDPTHQYIPNLWTQLKPLGTIYTSFYNDGVTQTNSAHSTILTGTWQSILNDGGELPHKPTVFEYFRKEKSAPASETYVVLGKTKLDILASSDHAEYGSSYGATVDTTAYQYDDVYTLENIKDVITNSHPHLIITNLAGTDRAGHDGPWANYISKLQRADSCVNELWNFIQSDPIYKDKTTLIITNDHGRHTTNFSSHGDGCEGCRHILTLIIGPDTPVGAVDSTRRTQIDIAPTVGQLLSFSTIYSTGNLITSAFITPVAENYSLQQGWNLISVPRTSDIPTKSHLFPTAISSAYAYSGSYIARDTLQTGVGYWIKFSSAQNVTITGFQINSDTIDIVEGWNLIGSLSVPISVNNISSNSPDITLSQFFDFPLSYQISDTLKPCRGYWVKSNQSGQLFLNIQPRANPVTRVNVNELPPSPPDLCGESIVPKFISLDQNYPNPFNPSTTITYQISQNGLVKMQVFDILGRQVALLLNEYKSAGVYTTEWDAGKFTGGVYYCRLQTGNQIQTIKMILVE
jgi:hypothetical protein